LGLVLDLEIYAFASLAMCLAHGLAVGQKILLVKDAFLDNIGLDDGHEIF